MNQKNGFLADLFAGVGNTQWDLGRIMGFLAFLPMVAAVIHNIRTGQAVDLMALGGGIAAIYTAVAILIAAKDVARTNAIHKVAQDATAATVADTASKIADMPPAATIVEGDLKAENIETVEVSKGE